MALSMALPVKSPNDLIVLLKKLASSVTNAATGTVKIYINEQGRIATKDQMGEINTYALLNETSVVSGPLAYKIFTRLNPPSVPAGKDGVLFVDENGILCSVNAFGVVTAFSFSNSSGTVWDGGAVWDSGSTWDGGGVPSGVLWDSGASWDDGATTWAN